MQRNVLNLLLRDAFIVSPEIGTKRLALRPDNGRRRCSQLFESLLVGKGAVTPPCGLVSFVMDLFLFGVCGTSQARRLRQTGATSRPVLQRGKLGATAVESFSNRDEISLL